MHSLMEWYLAIRHRILEVGCVGELEDPFAGDCWDPLHARSSILHASCTSKLIILTVRHPLHFHKYNVRTFNGPGFSKGDFDTVLTITTC